MIKTKFNQAQSTLEYVLVLAAVVGVIIFAAANWIKPNVKVSLDDAITAIDKAADEITAITAATR